MSTHKSQLTKNSLKIAKSIQGSLENGPRKKNIRLCVSCRQLKPRDQLLCLTAHYLSGEIILSAPILQTQKHKPMGRSVYVCLQQTCWQAAFKTNRLKSALTSKHSAKSRRTRIIKWIIDEQIIHLGASLCTEAEKTCHNTH